MALVVAETIAAAKDAAELVEVTYEPLPAVVRAADAVAPGAPTLWDEAPDNVCIDIEVGDAAATAAAFARAAHVVRLDTWAQRVTGVPMEPRTIAADYDAASGCYTLYTGSGRGVAKVRTDLAQILGVPAEQVRCVCGDMGGNFGTRNLFYPEYALLAWASRLVGRPVKWTCERSDSFLSDWQGRDLTVSGRAGARHRRAFPRHPWLEPQQSRRARDGVRAIAKGHRPDVQRLRDPGRPFPRPRCRHQHGADDALTAAPAGPRRSLSSNGWSIWRPTGSASTRPNCAAAT